MIINCIIKKLICKIKFGDTVDIEQFENDSLFYYKVIDSMTLSKSKGISVLDASFTNLIVPGYIAKKYGYNKIFYITEKMVSVDDRIIPVHLEANLPYTIMRRKCDLFVSVAGCFKFNPVYDIVHAIHKCLNVGGRFVIAVYPNVFDESGRDVLNGLSMISEIPIKEKLSRMYGTLKNAFSNIFFKVETEEVITQVESKHIIDFFSGGNVSELLFRKNEAERFFRPVAHLNIDYTASWNILKGIKI